MPKPGSSRNQESAPVLGWIVLILIGLAAFWIVGGTHPEDRKQSDTIIVNDDKKQSDDPKPQPSGNLKDCVLLVIHDKKTTSESIEYTTTIQDDAFWDRAATLVKDVEFLEDDDDIGKKWLSTSKGSSPLVLLVNTASKKIEWSMPLPKGTTEPIAKRLQ
jgi:hypothetical protein